MKAPAPGTTAEGAAGCWEGTLGFFGLPMSYAAVVDKKDAEEGVTNPLLGAHKHTN